MFYISTRGVALGVLSLFGIIAATYVVQNILGLVPTGNMLYLAYVVLWALPGYIAARSAGRSGVANGALVGFVGAVVCGVVIELFFNSPPPGVESAGGLGMGLALAIAAIPLCSLGGLIWELHHRVKNKNL